MDGVKFYNKTELLKELGTRMGYSVKYLTLIKWERKGYIKPVGYMPYGKTTHPVYDDRCIDEFMAKLPYLLKDYLIKPRKNARSKEA